MCYFTVIIFFHFLFQVTFCCLPILPRPPGGNGGSSGSGGTSNGPITIPAEQSSTTTTAIIDEKAKSTFHIDHKNQSYKCFFHFSFSSEEGIKIKDETSSECTKTSSADDSAIAFLKKYDFSVTTSKGFDLSCSLNAVFEETDDGIILVDRVVRQSMKCSPSLGQCLTEDGPDYPNTCSFPFVYQDRIYQGCTDWKDGVQGDRLWCATRTQADQTMVPERWSWCNDFCDYCGGKNLLPNITTTTPSSPNTTSSLGGTTLSSPGPYNNSAATTDYAGECKTEKGKTCKFPFKEGKKEYTVCSQYKDLYHWCAVTTHDDGTYDEWDKCDPLSCQLEGAGECQTVSGPDVYKPCVFPFKDGSKEYTSCAPYKSKFWCATSVSSTGAYQSYGYCSTDGSCPVSSTKRTANNPRNDLTCGYNCYLDLKTQMDSFTGDVLQDLLLPPTPIVGELTDPSWNKLPGEKFQFLIGQKGVDLQCPEGSTFNKFQGDSRIKVSCTGEYSFTVEGLTTGMKWEQEKNVNFGCNPCPVNYLTISGYISSTNSLAFHNYVITLGDCQELCEKMEECKVFQYSGGTKQCALHNEKGQFSSTSEKGHQVCKSQKHKCATPLISGAIRSPDQDSIEEGDKVTYKCMPRTEMIGDSINTCTNTGLVKPPPSCAICCDFITFSFQPFDEPHENVGYYDKYLLQPDLKYGHVWYKSESSSGVFSIWKSKDKINTWYLGEIDSDKIEAELIAEGCPAHTTKNDGWYWVTTKRVHHKPPKQKKKLLSQSKCSSFWGLDIWTLPVGTGDSTIIKCPGTPDISIIDMGMLFKGVKKEHYVDGVTKFLKVHRYQVKHIFLTHPDTDHASFGKDLLTKILAESLMDQKIYIHLEGEPDKWTEGKKISQVVKDFINFLKKNTAWLIPTYYDETLNNIPPSKEAVVPICNNKNVKMEILTAGRGNNKNEYSMVMKLHFGSKSMLFMGDIEGGAYSKKKSTNWEDTMALPHMMPAIKDTDVIMVPHHGSDLGIGEDLLKAFYNHVRPSYAIISSHIMQLNGHPRLEVLQSICYRDPKDNWIKFNKASEGSGNGVQGWTTQPKKDSNNEYYIIDDGNMIAGKCDKVTTFYPTTKPVTTIYQTTQLKDNVIQYFIIHTTLPYYGFLFNAVSTPMDSAWEEENI